MYVAADEPTRRFDFWFPPKQGLKHSAGSIFPPLLVNLISDFHQNKDWNLYRNRQPVPLLEFDFWFPPKQGLKLSCYSTKISFSILFDFWFPPKQGLKLTSRCSTKNNSPNLISDFHQNKDWNSNLLYLCRKSFSIWFLISTKTRIETATSCFDKLHLTIIWFLISTKTRIETLLISVLAFPQKSFDFWFPPKQGLKHHIKRINREDTLPIWFLISTKTRIETYHQGLA